MFCRRLNPVVVLSFLAGALPVMADDWKHAEILVEPEALLEMLAHRDGALVLLDCRTRKEYEAARIGAARWVDTSLLKKMSLADDAPAAQEAWADWFSAHGVGADRHVIIYDDGNMTDAARVWFLLQYRGIRHVSVLNGGFAAAKAMLDDGRIATTSGPASEAEVTVPHLLIIPLQRPGSCPVGLADKDAVRVATGQTKVVILDVRTEAEFRGVDQEKNPRHGHIPQAVNIPHAQLLIPAETPPAATQPAAKPKGRLKSPADLRKLFEKHGVTADRPVVAHCQSGGRAALAALALVHAGYGDISNYYASFGEWSADPTLPIIAPSPTTAPTTRPLAFN